ncbi:hypothetical protein [Kitasatospora sp. MBT63]|uniref:hypothetical protein n=1 Tax=Kitasatospora sp. MBT63 TaxID=1444768 RepID=UPI001313E08F|nr:hypothetical protein [Kitasatospora sp. MBT63]
MPAPAHGGLGPVNPGSSLGPVAGGGTGQAHGHGPNQTPGQNQGQHTAPRPDIFEQRRLEREAELGRLNTENDGQVGRTITDLGREQRFLMTQPPNADRLVADMPRMSEHDRMEALGNLRPEYRRWLASNEPLVDNLRNTLSPQEFARTAARLMVDVDPRVSDHDAARSEAEKNLSQMLQDPEVTATLLKGRAGMYVVPKDVPMTEAAPYRNLRGTEAAGDAGGGRKWEDVRGSGGRRAAATEENLLGEHTTVGGMSHYDDGYSTTTHEFAHTIHRQALGPSDRQLITDSYQAKIDADHLARTFGEESPIQWTDGARRPDGQNGDNYASRDEQEYFAQVTNAYLGTNHGNDPYTGEPRNNGADWVRANEPDLLPLLERLYGPDPEPIRANPVDENDGLRGLRNLFGDEDPSGPPRPPAPTRPAPPVPDPAAAAGGSGSTVHPTGTGTGPVHPTGTGTGTGTGSVHSHDSDADSISSHDSHDSSASQGSNRHPDDPFADPVTPHTQAPPPPPAPPAPPVRTGPEGLLHADVPPPPPMPPSDTHGNGSADQTHPTVDHTQDHQTHDTHDAQTHDAQTHDTHTDGTHDTVTPHEDTTGSRDLPSERTPRPGWGSERRLLDSPEDRADQLREQLGLGEDRTHDVQDLVRNARNGKVDDLARWVDQHGTGAVHALGKEIPEHALWGLGRERPEHAQALHDVIAERRGGNPPSREEIQARQDVFDKLQQHESVTVVVESGPGSGHQAAAITLVRSLRELGYGGEIQMVAPHSVRERLERMLDRDELRVNEPVYVDKELDHETTYEQPVRPDLGRGPTFVAASDSLEANPKSAAALLSFTGADKAMLLTPYAWGHPRAVYERTPGEDGTPNYTAHHMDAGVSPDHGLYQFDIRTPEKVAFPDDPKLQSIADSVAGGKVDMMPVYGLARMEDRLRASGPEYLASAIRESGAHEVDGVKTYGKPAVMVEVGGREIGYAPKFEPSWLKRANLADLGAEDVSRMMSELKDGEVLLIRSDGTSQSNFEKLFQLGDLPAIQEGANTTNASQLTGRPYLSPNVGTTPYPRIHEPAAADLLQARVANALGRDGEGSVPDLSHARDAWDRATWRNESPSHEDYRNAADSLRDAAAGVDRLAQDHPDPQVARTLRDAAAQAREDASVLERSAQALGVNGDLTKATDGMNAGTEWSAAAEHSEPHKQLGKVKWGRDIVDGWAKEANQHTGGGKFTMPVDKLQDFGNALTHHTDRDRPPTPGETQAGFDRVYEILSRGLDPDDAQALKLAMDKKTWEGEMIRTNVTPSTSLGRSDVVRQNFETLSQEVRANERFYANEVSEQLGDLSNEPKPEAVEDIAEVLRGYRTPDSRFQQYTSEVNGRALDWRQDQLLMGLLHMDNPHVLTDESIHSQAQEQVKWRQEAPEREARAARAAEQQRQREEKEAQRQLEQQQMQERFEAARRARAEAAAAAAAAPPPPQQPAQTSHSSDEESDADMANFDPDDLW